MKFDRRFRACLLNLIAVVAIYFTFTLLINSGALNRYYRNILFSICINIIMAVSLNLTTGMLGELALGHAGFMAVGAFASAVITKSWAVSTAISFPVALIVGGLIAAVFGLVIGIPALRLKGDYLAIITLGFGEIIRVIITNLPITGAAKGLSGIPKLTNFNYVYIIMVLIIAAMFTLRHAHVLVVGLGGVGAYAAEMICRAGVGRMTIVDADIVQPSNINRQLSALYSTMGRPKAEILAERFRDINPDLELTVLVEYLKDERIPELLDSAKFDFVVDAIDTVAPKCYLIYNVLQRRLPIVSSMGAGAKWDITQVRFADLWDTYHCGLSKAVRKRLQKMGMKRKLPVVFSTEQADQDAVILVDDEKNKKSTAGTVSYMPAVFGCYLAEYVIRRI